MRKLWPVAVVSALTGLLVLAPGAFAANIIVNSTTDTAVDTDDGLCTLREAMDNANTGTGSGNTAGECGGGSIGNDNILFTGAFNGVYADDTIGFDSTLGTLPVITEQVTIDGCNNTDPNFAKPCVGIERTVGAGVNSFDVNANNVTIRGIAITTPATSTVGSIRTRDGVTGFTLKNTWVGLKLDQTAIGIEAIKLLGDGATIGGDGGASGASPADRNVFAMGPNTSSPNMLIRGDNNQVRGNYFGTLADGTTLPTATASSAEDQIKIAGPSLGDAPVGNSIGAAIDSGSAAVCDDACNLIAAGSADGIDLNGESGETPADTTTIAGNFIGLDVGGTLDLGSNGRGIQVGLADNTTIGGATAASQNVISGHATQGIQNDVGSANLLVRNNLIGLNSAGTAALPNEVVGTVINGGTFSDNRLGGTASFPSSGGLVIGQTVGATATTARGNVFGTGTGGEDVGLPGGAIQVSSIAGQNSVIGGTGMGEGNVIGNMRGVGSIAIGIAADSATIQGNLIGVRSDGTTAAPNGGRGIQLVSDADSVQIGGTTAASENVISNNALDAIEISGNDVDQNSVLRNRGSGNGTGVSPANHLFLDLNPLEGIGNDGPLGPNLGIGAPAIDPDPATSAMISGTGNTGDVVRVYRTATPAGQGVKDIIGFVGQTTVGGGGTWTLNCASVDCPIEPPATGQVTANATDVLGNSSEFTVAAAYTAVFPTTTILSGPDNGAVTADSTPTFDLSSNEDPNVTYECRIDSTMEAAFAMCPDPFTTPVLANGAHTVDVRAVDTGGHKDATPDTANFTVDTTVPPAPPAATPTPTSTPAPVKKCKKGRKLRKGKCVKKKRKR